MKKQITIFVLLLIINCSFAWSQTFVKISTPCNNDLLKKTPGLWIKEQDGMHVTISKQQQQEIFNRLDAIHQFVFNVFPSPVGIDASWARYIFSEEFASHVKFDHTAEGRFRENSVNGIPVLYFSYGAKFNPYTCGRTAYEMRRGYPSEDGPELHVDINALGSFITHLWLDSMAEVMQIDDRPIKMMPTVKGKWKGYVLYGAEIGSGQKMILLHREGMLPYTPVTRKQYLDRCIAWIPRFFKPDLKVLELMPDKRDRDEMLKKSQQVKDDVLKHYQDELAATTDAGLLDSPAIIPSYILNVSTTSPVFTTEAAGGKMLVTENPVYLRKDLPKYIPQFMIFTWYPYFHVIANVVDPYKAIDENFPIEKLQAMIDK